MLETTEYIKSINFNNFGNIERDKQIEEIGKIIKKNNELLQEILILQARKNYLELNKKG